MEASDPIFSLGCRVPIRLELGDVRHKEWLGFHKVYGIPESSGERAAKWPRGIHQIIKGKKEEPAQLVHVDTAYPR